ncbi:MAG TPA: hypothetical protein VGE01_01790 [Fimbriimonas sp.]
MQIVPFHGWERNARLVCRDVEMIVTLDVGPRVLGYGFVGERNQLAVRETTAGMVGGAEFRSYGGHRLWIAPEEAPRTFQPDNEPIQHREEDGWSIFTAEKDAYFTQKEIRIRPDEERGCFRLVHRIYNHSAYDLELAPWTPTQFAVGGEAIFPQPDYIPHGQKLLPARPLVLWNYTKMSDPRWTWGDRVVRLRQSTEMGPTKVGALVQQGIAVYCNQGDTYLRRFSYEESATYPDFGCNFETFTRQDMLEIESLGPLRSVPKGGGFVEHPETWYLLRHETAPEDDAECGEWLARLARDHPL